MLITKIHELHMLKKGQDKNIVVLVKQPSSLFKKIIIPFLFIWFGMANTWAVNFIAPTINSSAVTSGTYGVLYTYDITTQDGVGILTISDSGLPSGLVLTDNNDGTAQISGSPTVTGPFSVTITVTDANLDFDTQNFTLTISKATASVVLANLSQIYTGNPLVATATTTPSGLTVDFTYDGSPTPPTDAGSYAVVGTINDVNYEGSAVGTLIIAKAPLTATADDKARVYAAANPALTITYAGFVNGETSVVLDVLPTAATSANASSPVGVVPITLSGGSDNNYDFTLNDGSLTISKATASVVLANLSQIYTGNPLVATATTTPAGLTVDFTYDGAPTPPTNAGSYAVVGTINDVNYEGSSSETFIINKATATITLGNLTQIYTGSPLAATATSLPGGLTIDLTYDGSPTAPTNAGTYAFAATINDANYEGINLDVFEIQPATALISITDTLHNFDGSPKSVTVLTTPLGVSVSTTYDGSPTAPTAPGNYTVLVVIANPNYTGSNSAILAINGPPTENGITNITVDEDASNSAINLGLSFDDAEDSDSELIYSVTSNSNPALFNDIQITGITLIIDYKENENGNATIFIRATDTGGLFVETSFSITINPVADPPVITSTPLTGAVQGQPYSYLVTATDPDGDVLSITAPILPHDWLSIIDNGDGTANISGTPSSTDVGTHGVAIEARDPVDNTDTQAFSIVVTNTNDPPMFTSTPITVATEDNIYTYNITSSDPDVGDTRMLSATTPLPSWLVLTDNGDGTGTLIGTPLNGDIGNNPVALVVTDATGATDFQSFDINVDNANDQPVFTSTAVISATEDAVYSYAITSSDPDVGDTRTISALSKPNWLTLVDNLDGTATLSGTPANEDVGVASIVLSVTDVLGAFDVQSFSITVANTNDVPTFISTPDTIAKQNVVYNYSISTLEIDLGDVLSITAPILPPWLILTDNQDGTAMLTGTPTINEVGNLYTVELEVKDLLGASNLQSFSILVKLENSPPTLNPIVSPVAYSEDSPPILVNLSGISAGEESNQSITLSTNHNNADLISSIAINYTSPAIIGSLEITLQPNANGLAQIEVTVLDDGPSSLNSTTEIFELSILPVNDPPVIISVPSTAVAPSTIYSYTLQATDPDINDQLSFSILNVPTWLSLIDNNNGTAVLSGTAPTSGSSFPIAIEVTDLDNETDKQEFILFLNESPVISNSTIEVEEDLVYSFTETNFSGNYIDQENDNLNFIKVINLPTEGLLQLNQIDIVPEQIVNFGDLNKLEYKPNPNFSGSDNFTWQGSDGVSLSNIGNLAISITSVNDAPELNNIETNPLIYKQGSLGEVLTETITINDIDDSNIDGAIIGFTSNFLKNEDVLIFEDTDFIKGDFNSDTGFLVLEGSDSKSNYEQALHRIKYVNTNLDNTSTAERVINIIVRDMSESSNSVSRTILIDEVKPEPDFIDAFTPNGDGTNDVWEIRKIGSYSSVDVSIYDSKGQLVFHTNDYKSHPWNGTLDGEVLPTGAYFYKVLLEGGERIFEGAVNILR